MREVSSPTLHRRPCCFHVHPHEVSEEGLLKITVNVCMVKYPHQLIYSHDGLTHGFNEPILSLK